MATKDFNALKDWGAFSEEEGSVFDSLKSCIFEQEVSQRPPSASINHAPSMIKVRAVLVEPHPGNDHGILSDAWRVVLEAFQEEDPNEKSSLVERRWVRDIFFKTMPSCQNGLSPGLSSGLFRTELTFYRWVNPDCL